MHVYIYIYISYAYAICIHDLPSKLMVREEGKSMEPLGDAMALRGFCMDPHEA